MDLSCRINTKLLATTVHVARTEFVKCGVLVSATACRQEAAVDATWKARKKLTAVKG